MLPLLSMRHFLHVHWPLTLVHLACSWIGVMSTWYHSRLSLAGQLMDEWAILWAIHITFAVAWPYLIMFPHKLRRQ